MDSKKRVLRLLTQSRFNITQIIKMVDEDKDCLKVHHLLKQAITELELAKKELSSHYFVSCVNKLYKNNNLGKKAREEVINLFQT